MNKKTQLALGTLRISLGWIFLWAFLDKLFGLSFTTEPAKAWIAGGSPTQGFLQFATKGPLADLFQSLAGSACVDWIFMIGLLGIGLGLILGIFMRIATISGIIMMILMYISGFLPPEHNPIMDDHLVYAIALALLSSSRAGDYLGFGKQWKKTRLVIKLPFLT